MATDLSPASNLGVLSHAPTERLWPYYVLFFVSGFPALLYQIVWQRTLFTIYGVDIQSVTVIVTAFMLGLGLGSLAGGRLSTIPGLPALRAFGAIELSVGIFGAFSLWIFHSVAGFTAGGSVATTGTIAFLLLLVPTLLMGSTLPLLVSHLVERTENVGASVGSLYAVNTFGSGFACLLAAFFLMRTFGELGSVRLAATLNILVGTTALLWRSPNAQSIDPAAAEAKPPLTEIHWILPLPIAMALACATGFIALAYEILWYRLYAFTSGGTAPCFAKLLAYYLFGIAYGSLAVRDVCRTKLRNDLKRTLWAGAVVVFLGTITSYLLGPALSIAVIHAPYDTTFVFVTIAAALLGAAFPLLSHASIGPQEQSGRKLSYLYMSNIIGSALGSFLVGFVILNYLSTKDVSVLLLVLGSVIAAILAVLARPVNSKVAITIGATVCILLAALSGPLFAKLYERLLFKDHYDGHFVTQLVENRSGEIAVDNYETVYGSGVYDGHFNTSPLTDTNGIFRAYAIAGLHPRPRKVLIIGLSSGSWAQIVANHPEVEDVTIVEINPGYLGLIRERASVASLLVNPKVHIVIDDGRRWLVGHPAAKFDFILMNTTFNWRSNITNLLSTQFLQLVRSHLLPGGVEYYNTTLSGEALLTGATAYPYALRIGNFIAVSDNPIVLDRAHWRTVLEHYKIDGRPVFDLSDPAQRDKLSQMVSEPEATSASDGGNYAIEDKTTLLPRLKEFRLITDDNMGTEWQ